MDKLMNRVLLGVILIFSSSNLYSEEIKIEYCAIAGFHSAASNNLMGKVASRIVNSAYTNAGSECEEEYQEGYKVAKQLYSTGSFPQDKKSFDIVVRSSEFENSVVDSILYNFKF